MGLWLAGYKRNALLLAGEVCTDEYNHGRFAMRRADPVGIWRVVAADDGEPAGHSLGRAPLQHGLVGIHLPHGHLLCCHRHAGIPHRPALFPGEERAADWRIQGFRVQDRPKS